MRYFLALILFLAPFTATALTGPESRFDWSLGQPSITANATAECTGEATARFDWSLGQPSIVYDATATCDGGGGGGGAAPSAQDVFWYD